MKWLKWLMVGVFCVKMLTGSMIASPDSSTSDLTPQQCPPDLVCFTIEEAHKINVKLIRLEEEIKKQKARKRRALGFGVGCGPVVSIGDQTNLDLACGLTWGWRFH